MADIANSQKQTENISGRIRLKCKALLTGCYRVEKLNRVKDGGKYVSNARAKDIPDSSIRIILCK